MTDVRGACEREEGPDERFERERLDDLLTLTPLLLPGTLADNESRAMYQNLGVRLRGGKYGTLVLPARLPDGWSWRRAGARWVEVRDDEQKVVIRAFYKLVPYDPSTRMYLTEHGMDLLRQRWDALPRWRKIFTLGRHWGVCPDREDAR
ncbi:hypothetical protein [Streptomyces bacillaris]|uniref:hypothetical protein n=1 Tax=Streptomyces bacillaris TaxID=68179 RepID=UPI00345F2964